jgi:hypothetical protein
VYKIFIGKREGLGPLSENRRRMEDNIKIVVWFEDMDCGHMTQDRDQ